jgi:GH35 family endo-1,4-beta-xylanase
MADPIRRRTFLRQSGAFAIGGFATTLLAGAPTVLTARRTARQTTAGRLVFRPMLVQAGRGPHLSKLVYATDLQGDTFRSDIAVSGEGVTVSDLTGQRRFGVNVRWNVEGFGYLFLTADNGSQGYELPSFGAHRTLNLNYELAKSRAARNARRVAQLSDHGWTPSRDVRAYLGLTDEYLADAARAQAEDTRCGELAQKALFYALWAGEGIELERAAFDIERAPRRDRFFFGCDARAYFQMDADLFLERFTELFTFATVNHYLIGTHQDFEPARGDRRFDLRDALVNQLRRAGITIEGRPLVWFHHWVTPDWLRRKSYPELLKYVEQHVREVVRHYDDRIHVWEIANEMHDWANELRLSPDQLVEVTKLACEVARDTNPRVLRLINNCCVFGEYVHQRKWTELDATYPQRTPHQFMRALVEVGAPFDITGVQMYFPTRDLADSMLLIDRFGALGRPVHVTETGATSGPSPTSVKLDTLPLPTEPYAWHRHWDEELQAEWAESLYTLAYSRPYVQAISWYDFVDPHSYIRNGGLLRSPAADRKPVFDRLKRLQARWGTHAAPQG